MALNGLVRRSGKIFQNFRKRAVLKGNVCCTALRMM